MTEITANYDATWKEAIGIYFEDFLLFFYPEIHQIIDWSKTPVALDKELEQITGTSDTEKRYADRLFKVWLLEGKEIWILIHIEVQSQYDSEFPLRMFIYNYRAFDLYHKPVISLAILGDKSRSWRPTSYQYGWGKNQVKIEFSSIKLRDYQEEVLEASNNPFAVVVMAHLKTQATNNNLTKRQQFKWELSRRLYERDWRKQEIINLLKFIDKMMTLPPELELKFKNQLKAYEEERQMPFLCPIEEMAIEQGAKETRQKDILAILNKRFGQLPDDLVKAVHQIDDLTRLEQLVLETISVNSLEEFNQLIG